MIKLNLKSVINNFTELRGFGVSTFPRWGLLLP